MEHETWKQIAGGLRRRWDDASKPDVKNELGQALVPVLNHLGTTETLDFLRTQLAKGPEQYRAQYAQQLFQTLLNQPWSADYENEAFTLVQRLSTAEDNTEREAAWVRALYQMTDRMVQARYNARMQSVEHQEKLTRTELRAKQEENLKAARQGYADRLREVMGKSKSVLTPWYHVERLYLDVLVGRDLDKAAEECLYHLEQQPPKTLADYPPLVHMLNETLRHRFAVPLSRTWPLARRGEEGPGRARAGVPRSLSSGRARGAALETAGVPVARRPR